MFLKFASFAKITITVVVVANALVLNVVKQFQTAFHQYRTTGDV